MDKTPTIDHGMLDAPRPAAEHARGCRRFEGRNALLTAAARGIGLASALRLAAEGAQVWITDVDADALDQACEHAAASGLQLHPVQMNSLDAQEVADRMADVLVRARRLDILVNNAGGSLHTPYRFAEQDAVAWQRVMDLNLMGTVWACQAVLPSMVANGFGRIVNFGSKAGRFGSLIAGANYAAAKGAISALGRQLAMEYGPHGITVNCICPGVVMTPRTRGLWSQRRTSEEREQVLQEIPLRRHCEVDDVAASVAFLASDDASFLTGVTLDLNGGQAMA
jgi:3-oxoacyl-[acyl-carrier protein] reductase/2-hydroxycyclohexanecarboxyl-CoA dehydrogenase